mmetsp:Transcript_10862/g.33515  ORF Transcript_10862/g.33515 Transcript_10862/m.33515 type:complete len:494 (-) Transcript_10862:266-1747(-)
MEGAAQLWMAIWHYHRNDHSRCSEACVDMLRARPMNEAAVFFMCRTLSLKSWQDDCDLESEGLTDLMFDETTISAMPRPGTSIVRPPTSSIDQCVRPVSSLGRPLTGFATPGSANHPISGQVEISRALLSSVGESSQSRPVTSFGQTRLYAKSMAPGSGIDFLSVERLELTRFVHRLALARAICDYLIYHKRNFTYALELCAEVSAKCASKCDWWWKVRLARCYYRLGLYRDAERQLIFSLQDQTMSSTVLELSRVYMRLDQPNAALRVLQKATEEMPEEPRLKLCIARVHEMMYAFTASVVFYKKVLLLDASNVEGLACLAANYFYAHQPELSLRYYRRLLQMGVSGPEIWNNLGLCCFYSSQFDMALGCFDRALQWTDDAADIWYNIGHLGIGIGDTNMAYQAFKVTLSLNKNHPEALCNLSVLELHNRNTESAEAYLASAQETHPNLFQSYYNGALLTYKFGNFQASFTLVSKSCFPGIKASCRLKLHFE